MKKMKSGLILICQMLIVVFLFVTFNINAQTSAIKLDKDSRQRLLFNDNWKFSPGDISGAEDIRFNDRLWRNVTLPHDWSIEGEFDENASTGGLGGYLPTGIGWYRKHFSLTATGQNLWIEFDGIYMNSDIWINGNYLGKHTYGYNSFYLDLTPFVRRGDNVIAVKVDNSVQPNSRWYSGSGIYRNAWLNAANPVHIPQWGTYITTPAVDSLSATVSIRTKIDNNLKSSKNAVLRSRVIDKNGNIVAEIESPVSLNSGSQQEFRQQLQLKRPYLWSVDTPSMYALHSSVVADGKTIDHVVSPFGIRSIEYCSKRGFLLNGERVKMNGVNLHHDAGSLGAAVPVQVWERRLKILKEMGVNAIRTAHNPMAPEFMDLCDQMGFLVMNELFDEWEIPKGQITSGYHLHYKDNWKKDVINFVHRDRNHPSVVIWSAGNEIAEQSVVRGQAVLGQLIEVFHAEDPTRPVTVGNDQIASEPRPALLPFLEMQDVVGYNYAGRWRERRELYYTIDRINHPDWIMIGTENGSVRGGRGAFSLGNDPSVVRPNYLTGMIGASALWRYTAIHDYVCGDFMWTGIDYLGESRWPARGSGSGVIDLAGFPKPGFYFYQSQWTKKPMIHIFPHWNWEGREGQVIPVLVYSNCESVELFLNGKSFGEQRLEFPSYGMAGGWAQRDRPSVDQTTDDLHLSWTVPYEPGELKAVGKIRGEVVFTEILQTAGKPVALRISSDKAAMRANGDDVAHVTVEIVDSNGTVVPDAGNEIFFTVKGEARLLGLESGDVRSHETGHFRNNDPSKPNGKKAYNGLILGYIQAGQKPGNINVEVSSPGLKGGDLRIVIN
jgi:beta-galactosidase